MFGGQSHPDFDNDMAAFIEPTRQEIRKEFEELEIPQDKIEELVEQRLIKRIHQKIIFDGKARCLADIFQKNCKARVTAKRGSLFIPVA